MLYQRKIKQTQLLASKLEFQLLHSRYAFIGTQAVGVLAITALLWFQLPIEQLLSWASCMCLAMLLYSLRIGDTLERQRFHSEQRQVYREMLLAAVIIGASWSGSVLWGSVTLRDDYFYVLVLIVIAICVTTISVSSVMREVYLAQLLATLVPIGFLLGWQYAERPFNLVLAGLALMLTLLMSLVSGWMSRSFGQMVESSLEREAMARDLAELSDNLRLRNVQLQEARRQLADIATIDELTGLRNRRGANQLLETEISRSKRAATPLALIMLDVDHFKFYNDTYGHPAGDVVLQKVAEVLLSVTSRAGELAVRMGGEEFMLILPGSTGSDAMRTAEKVQNEILALAISHAASPVSNCVTVSQGVVACIPRLHTSTEELIKAADAALYESKNDGRNRASLSPFHT